VSGFMNMGAQIGGAVTASLTPAIAARFGWTASFLVAAGLCFLGALAWMVVDPTRTLQASPHPAADIIGATQTLHSSLLNTKAGS
jgi:MFS transporter, ACS family, glucarate transporter